VVFRLQEHHTCWLLAVAAVALFFIDLSSPLGFATGNFYLPLVVAAALLCSSRTAVVYTSLCLLLMGIEIWYSADPISSDVRRLALINRGLAMLMAAVMAAVMIPVRRIRAALSASRERYEAVVENSAEAILVSRDNRIEYANPAAVRLFGAEQADELIGRQADSLIHRTDGHTTASEQQASGTVSDQQLVTLSGAPLNAEVVSSRFVDSSGRAVQTTIRDISERKRAEDEILRLNAELEERVRQRTMQLEAVNRELEAFTYSVSHDLRAPLRGMSGFARVLEEDYGDKLDDDGRRYLQIIKSNAAQMGQLIDDLLALSRLGRQPLRAATISLEQIAAAAFREVTADEPPRPIEFTIEPLPNCRGDANLMHQVFVNLLSNAVKFTRHRSPARIQVGSLEQNGERVYFVRDNGAGFDMRYVDKLFGVFQRLHGPDEFAGTGVGLAIVKRIVERHGGRIWAEGEPGKGATFWFTLGGEETHVG